MGCPPPRGASRLGSPGMVIGQVLITQSVEVYVEQGLVWLVMWGPDRYGVARAWPRRASDPPALTVVTRTRAEGRRENHPCRARCQHPRPYCCEEPLRAPAAQPKDGGDVHAVRRLCHLCGDDVCAASKLDSTKPGVERRQRYRTPCAPARVACPPPLRPPALVFSWTLHTDG